MSSRKGPAGAGSGLAAAGRERERERERERAHLELAELGPLLEEKGDPGAAGAATVSPSGSPGGTGSGARVTLLAPSPRIIPGIRPLAR